jgi:hypothetical protein
VPRAPGRKRYVARCMADWLRSVANEPDRGVLTMGSPAEGRARVYARLLRTQSLRLAFDRGAELWLESSAITKLPPE